MQQGKPHDNLRKRQIWLLRPLVLCTIALTSHWAWEHVMLYAPLFSHLPKSTAPWFANNVSLLVVFILILIFNKTYERLLVSHSLIKLLILGAIPEACGLLIRFTLFSTSLHAFTISDTVSQILTIISDSVVAFGLATLILVSIQSLSLFRRDDQERLLCFATVASLVVYVFVCALISWLQIAFIACLPIAVATSLSKIEPQGDKRIPPHPDRTNRCIAGFPLSDLLSLTFISMSLNFMRGIGSDSSHASALDIFSPVFAVLSVLVAALLLVSLLLEKRFRLPIKPLLILALTTCSSISFLLTPENFELPSILTFSAFFIYVTILYRTIARQVNPLKSGWCRVIAIGLIFNCVGLTLGSLISHALNTFADSGAPYAAVGILMIVVMFESTLHVFREERTTIQRAHATNNQTNKLENRLNSSEVLEENTPLAVQSLVEVLEADSYILADAYGLTKREREVLILLASGQSIQGIAERMHVSDNTAKSHCTAIYRKLDIHGKEEIFSFFEQADSQRIS